MCESQSSGELFCRLFDPADTGYVAVSMFRQILRTKHVSVSDITDMIEGKQDVRDENSASKTVFQSTGRLIKKKLEMKIELTTENL